MAISPLANPVAPALQERWAKLRSHKRIISKVKLLVEWDEGSASQCAHAVTVDVSVGNKVKTLIARKEHVVRMEGS